MNILIIGSGAREHALTRVLARTSPNACLFCYGNSKNPGIYPLVKQYWTGDLLQNNTILDLALNQDMDLVIIGPEAPLEQGLADVLLQHGIRTIGPTQNLARLETSKIFTRNLLKKYQIAGSPQFQYFQDLQGVAEYLEFLGSDHYVIKADGLMGGKGVKVAGDHLHSFTEALAFCRELTDQKIPFLIEEKLEGQEFSLLCMTDGLTLLPMPPVQDHKRAFENDEGPNTGGMGSYSCADHSLPFLTSQDIKKAMTINQSVLQALQEECGELYKGILYGSFMATSEGIKLIEYNARFGDPEAINILSLFEGDFAELCLALTEGNLQSVQVHFKPLATVCKYAVPLGYPDAPLKNIPINISAVSNPETLYYGAVNDLIATGSRTIAVLGQGKTLEAAEKMAQTEIEKIQGQLFHRKDIGTKILINKRIQHMQRLRTKVEVSC